MVSYLNTEPNVELQTSKCMKCWLNIIYVHLHEGYGLFCSRYGSWPHAFCKVRARLRMGVHVCGPHFTVRPQDEGLAKHEVIVAFAHSTNILCIWMPSGKVGMQLQVVRCLKQHWKKRRFGCIQICNCLSTRIFIHHCVFNLVMLLTLCWLLRPCCKVEKIKKQHRPIFSFGQDSSKRWATFSAML